MGRQGASGFDVNRPPYCLIIAPTRHLECASPIWPPTGLALAAVLLGGLRVLNVAGAFAANATTAGTVETAVVIALGNTLEAVTGGFLIERWSAGRETFLRQRIDAVRAMLATSLQGNNTKIEPACDVLDKVWPVEVDLGELGNWRWSSCASRSNCPPSSTQSIWRLAASAPVQPPARCAVAGIIFCYQCFNGRSPFSLRPRRTADFCAGGLTLRAFDRHL